MTYLGNYKVAANHKILILGSPGAGKTTFARKLHERIGFPLFHLDDLYWLPGWNRPSAATFSKKLKEVLELPVWILDGNYDQTLDERLSSADTVILLRANSIKCLYRVVKREIGRALGDHESLPAAVRKDSSYKHRIKFTNGFLQKVNRFNKSILGSMEQKLAQLHQSHTILSFYSNPDVEYVAAQLNLYPHQAPWQAAGLNFRPLPVLKHGSSSSMPVLYRSGHLHSLSKTQIEYMISYLHIGCYIDFRSVEEVEKKGLPQELLNNNVRLIAIPMSGYPNGMIEKNMPDHQDYAYYGLGILKHCAQQIKRFLENLMYNEEKAVVFGCNMGKDRTGIVSFVLLKILGASLQLIARHYALSTDYLLPEIDLFESHWTKRGLTKEEYHTHLTCSDSTIFRLHELLLEEYGSWDHYYVFAGIGPELRTKLQERFYLVSSPTFN